MDAAPVLDFSQLQGLVTFPSFHTVLAVIISYAMRVSRILATLTIPLNCIVIAGTITEGGHHLTDVIAGGFIAVFAILCVRRMSVATLSPARMSPACPRYELRPGLTI